MKSWATRPLFTCPSKIARLLTVVGLVVLVGLAAAPGLATLGWHLLHGNTIAARGKNIFVPLRWIAKTNETMGVSMTKLPLTVLSRTPSNGTILVGQSFSFSNQEKEERYKSFENLFWNLAVANAVVSGPIRTGTGAHETICMESTFPGASNHAEARCLILQGRWDAEFMGDKKDLGAFFEIIQKIN
jgi:hypothetical protein